MAGLDKSKVLPLSVLVAGSYIAWFGVHYWRSNVTWPSDPIKDVLTGKPLPSNARTDTTEITGALGQLGGTLSGLGGLAGTAATMIANAANVGQLIANTAMKYNGQTYVYGGSADRVGNWDCSSFVSYVLGHDLGFPLPGGNWGDPGFPPHTHGPTTLNYMTFGTGIDLKDVQAGDLIVSVEHIAIALSGTEMVSAQDVALGVGTSGFPAGFPSGPPLYRRVTQLAPASLTSGGTSTGSGLKGTAKAQ